MKRKTKQFYQQKIDTSFFDKMPDEDVVNKYCHFFSIFDCAVGFLKQTVRPWDLFQNRGSHGKPFRKAFFDFFDHLTFIQLPKVLHSIFDLASYSASYLATARIIFLKSQINSSYIKTFRRFSCQIKPKPRSFGKIYFDSQEQSGVIGEVSDCCEAGECNYFLTNPLVRKSRIQLIIV